MKVNCPECSTANAIPDLSSKKVNCTKCGMIIVIRKVLGEDWAEKMRKSSQDTTRRTPARITKSAARATSKGATKKTIEEAPESEGSGKTRRPTTGRRARASGRKKVVVEPVDSQRDSHRRTRGRSSKGVSPALLFSSLGALLVIAVVAIVFVMNKEDETPVDPRADKKAIADMETTANDGEDGSSVVSLDDVTNVGSSGDATTAKTATGEGEKPAAVSSKNSRRSKTDDESMEPFPAAPGFSPEQVAEAEKHVAVLHDIEATTELGVASDALRDMPYKLTIPTLINALLKLDPATLEDALRGFQVNQTLEMITFKDDIWESSAFNVRTLPTDPAELDTARLQRKQAVRKWFKWWAKEGKTWEPPKDDEDL
ncbi:MAG: hypothetical protein KDB53_15480 [Planctomycetes bacterium]|nr:hypothetical protein [Planctomycetota bacterium]